MRIQIMRLALMATLSLTVAARAAPGSPSRGFVSATGRISAGGLQGQWRELGELATGRYAIHADLGAYRTADIYDGQTRWQVDASGGSHPLDSAFARRAAKTEAWLVRFVWTGRGLAGFALPRPKWASEDGRRYRMVNFTPRGGQPIMLWFDAADDRLVKATRQGWFFTLSTTYAAYRDVDGRWLPFTMVSSAAGRTESVEVATYDFAAKAPENSKPAMQLSPDRRLIRP